MPANLAFNKLSGMKFKTVLDLGSGTGVHAEAFRRQGREVTTISLIPPADIIGDYMTQPFDPFDCLWLSHVLEHQQDTGAFLRKCFIDLKEDGILAVTVPPMKHAVVGGHVSMFNAGTLLYNLILSGFDCSKASVKTYGYNISVIVRKKALTLPELHMDSGDIERLAQFFPLPVSQGFDGNIAEVNW